MVVLLYLLMAILTLGLIFIVSSFIHLTDVLVRVRQLWKESSFTDKKKEDFPNHGFSVVICCHNELKNLKKNLRTILNQDYPQFEVIVVLDRSEDGSFEFLQPIFEQEEKLRVLTINHVPDTFHPKKYGITTAIEIASFEWILLTDADCQPVSEQWIHTFNEKISKETKLILGVSPYVSQRSFISQWTDFETFMTSFQYIPDAIMGRPYMGVGRNLAYRKSLFRSSGGFGNYQHVTGGDDDLFVQAHANDQNTRINIEPLSITLSEPKGTWSEYFRQKIRHYSVGRYYKAPIQWQLTIRSVHHALMWLSFLILVSFSHQQGTILVVFTLLLILKGLISRFASSKLNTSWNPVLFPAFDFVYALILPVIGLSALRNKNVRWK